MLGLGDEDAAERTLVGDLELVRAARRRRRATPREPLTSNAFWLIRPRASLEASSVPMAPSSNSTVAANASSTSRPSTNVSTTAVTASGSPTR